MMYYPGTARLLDLVRDAIEALEAASAPPRNDAERLARALSLYERIHNSLRLGQAYQDILRLDRTDDRGYATGSDLSQIAIVLQDIIASSKNAAAVH